MRRLSLFSTIAVSIIFLGCENTNSKEIETKSDSRVEINKIEKNITHKSSSIGCKDKTTKECTQKREIDSANFILNALNVEAKKSKIKSGLDKLAENSSKEDIKEKISKIVEDADNQIEDIHEKKIATPPSIAKDVKVIKKSLEELVESTNPSNRIKIKKEIEKLVEKSVDKKNINKTKKTLEHLVEEIEKDKKNKKLKNMTEALIDDIATKRVDIVKETKKYFIIKVKKGDSLSLLAQRYYKDSKKYKLIYEANRDKIGSNFEIFPGTELKIPKI